MIQNYHFTTVRSLSSQHGKLLNTLLENRSLEDILGLDDLPSDSDILRETAYTISLHNQSPADNPFSLLKERNEYIAWQQGVHQYTQKSIQHNQF